MLVRLLHPTWQETELPKSLVLGDNTFERFPIALGDLAEHRRRHAPIGIAKDPTGHCRRPTPARPLTFLLTEQCRRLNVAKRRQDAIQPGIVRDAHLPDP